MTIATIDITALEHFLANSFLQTEMTGIYFEVVNLNLLRVAFLTSKSILL